MCAQVLNFRKSRIGLCRCFELNLTSRIATFSRDPVSARCFKSVGSLTGIKSNTFKMSKISKMFKVSSSSSSSSRPSSGSVSRSKHRSRSGPSPQEAINRLRETEAMLTKKQEYLESRIEQEIMIAKKNGTKNKIAALQALKRKKRFEQQLTQIDGTLSTIEFQREALENATTNTEVLKNMGYAAKAIKGVHQNIDLDKIDSLMQDITEQQEVAQEISDAISKPFGDQFDEDELLAELAELEQEELEESMKNMGRLPSVPTTKLPSARPSHRPQRREWRTIMT
ncbi:charged multivesicular body protein 4c-like isoform X2 [Sinocyclocheilus rhinocerous]|uniref:charged multivesicular body protein 4c-like isoform X2 n=1 Tax=Sinocyclocheilus rhinocerous TaxID=307959 RepID=UPI0007B8F355|nr:PREDICTED: charged multivesicular body protein 4c-like isoform X2 [Sinocyclocheilus rhinocerous]